MLLIENLSYLTFYQAEQLPRIRSQKISIINVIRPIKRSLCQVNLFCFHPQMSNLNVAPKMQKKCYELLNIALDDQRGTIVNKVQIYFIASDVKNESSIETCVNQIPNTCARDRSNNL